ncbi:glycosyltransferase family 1 protein [Ceratobasidium sp. AG-Ba]|nr:glycosyltransferase family 1 protein [Ceratobasidium sp. AG-Ba]QRW10577.1 glycosyltransferase family 1 protein [Ceratobasidium sp. AG-Ba]
MPQEPIAALACATAFTKPLQVLCVGPNVDLPPAPQVKPDETSDFLDKAHAELGSHSVIYMAFGTVFFPLPESARHLEVLVEEIVAHGFRLVFALCSEQANVREALVERLTREGKAIFPKWTNQVNVIEHPAIHYVMSHGGWNTTTEAIVRNVPIIFWPFAGNQPFNTAQVTAQHDCGFELLQVRTGAAGDKAYSGTTVVGTDETVRGEIQNVLEMSKDARGMHQRINVKALGRIIRESISKEGSGDIALEDFGELIEL